ncbi:MAG TPA: class I SAM-dependent RNA methyltransferase [Acidimicrobiia bacterium]|nr:class I SAM-dependent RNA methyltransferase [Acidimicrobiia bacterium]
MTEPTLRLTPDRMAHGGRAIARHDGQAVFVSGAIPGDTVEALVVRKGKRHLEAVTSSVVEPSPDRVSPPCIYFGSCGGCQWQHADYQAQLAWKQEIVIGQLRHLARLDTEVRATAPVGPAYGYRNRIDLHVEDGRLGLFREGTHDLVAIESCLVVAPPLAEMLSELGDLSAGELVTLRAGIRTGERLVMVDDDFGRLHEEVAGKRFRISGRSFFQNNTGGAEALVAIVQEILQPTEGELLLDVYAGGGLFSATVGEGLEVVAVESDPLAVTDLKVNSHAQVVAERFERATSLPPHWDIAVVDPPRTGLGSRAVELLAGGFPRAIAYVSCDPASFARDAGLLALAGYGLKRVQPLDLFPQTFHIELVGMFLPGR